MDKKHKVDYHKIAHSFNEYKNIEFKTDAIWYTYLENLLKEWKEEIKLILDYWCGSGNFTETLVNNNLEVIGIDISESLLKEAQHRIPDGNFMKIDIESELNLLFEDNYFDAVIFNYVLCEIGDQKHILNILHQVYQTLKHTWKVYIHNANRDKSNWIDFNTYRNNFKENLQEGDKIICTLKTPDKEVDVYDYFWSQKTYVDMLQRVWFKNIEVKELFWDDIHGRWNEIAHSPCYIIIWTK